MCFDLRNVKNCTKTIFLLHNKKKKMQKTIPANMSVNQKP